MRIIDCDENFTKFNKPVSIALGNFDGIHKGHKKLIEKAIKIASMEDAVSSVLLFKQHSKSRTGNIKTGFLTSLEDKLVILKDMGLDIVYIKEFDESFMKLGKRAFVEDILINKLNAKHLICGDDYSFAYMAEGHTKDLKKMQENYDYSVHIVDYVLYKGERISSSRIRNDIKLGLLENANDMLGRSYTIKGKIVRGDGRGKLLGFATANLMPDFPYVIPKSGVYLTRLCVKNNFYYGMTDIGINPTFKEMGNLKIETYIFDFDADIYSEDMELSFLRFERDDMKFNSPSELVDQLRYDENLLRSWIEQF